MEHKITDCDMDTCVVCGSYVPEGTMVCESCKKTYLKDDDMDNESETDCS